MIKEQTKDDVIKFLKNNIEPLENNAYGLGYRASVYLTDGTFLPCVIFRNSKTIVELAIRRFKEEYASKIGLYEIMKTFVVSRNCINDYDISRVEKSKFAFPKIIQKQIQGETSMSWTGFVVNMKDSKSFSFGTTFLYEFFDMPDNYSVDDIKEIINHSYVSKNGKICSLKSQMSKDDNEYYISSVLRERPFFECFIDDL